MSQIENKTIFEDMPIPSAARKLMVPTVLSSLVMVIYSLADTYFVGMLNDPIQNAAVTLVAPVMLAFNAINNLFGVGSSSMMSRALGRKDFDTVKQSAAFGFYCSLVGGLLISMLCLLFQTSLLTLLGADTATMEATAAYMKWTVLFGAAPSIINVVMAYFVRSEGAAFHASIGTMSGCILNIILDPVFIMPWGLGMGAAGAGLATFISNCVACGYFIVLLFIKRGRTFISLNPKDFTLKKEIVLGVCGVGVPASIQNLLNVIGMTILNNLMSGYGTEAVAAIGIAQKIYMIPMQVALGGTQGIMPLVGYSYSSGNYRRMDDTIRFVRRLLIPCLTVVAVLGWIFAPGLIRFFIKNPEIIRYGAIFLRAFCLAIVFLTIDFLGIGVFQSMGKGKISLVFAILRKLVFEIPATLILNGLFGINGIAYGAFVAELILAGISTVILTRIMKGLLAQIKGEEMTEQSRMPHRPDLDDYKFTVLWKDDIMADVELFDKRRKVRIVKHKNTFPENPFYGGEVTPERVYRFLEGRCMDRNRPCIPEYLEGLGLEEYNPYEIVKITHGVMWEDFQWLRFPGEEISWKDVKIRD